MKATHAHSRLRFSGIICFPAPTKNSFHNPHAVLFGQITKHSIPLVIYFWNKFLYKYHRSRKQHLVTLLILASVSIKLIYIKGHYSSQNKQTSTSGMNIFDARMSNESYNWKWTQYYHFNVELSQIIIQDTIQMRLSEINPNNNFYHTLFYL